VHEALSKDPLDLIRAPVHGKSLRLDFVVSNHRLLNGRDNPIQRACLGVRGTAQRTGRGRSLG
jgi:hypothetical protein